MSGGFSFTYPKDATPAEIAARFSEARTRAEIHAANRASTWWLNEAEREPGLVDAVRLRDGRFLECEDGPEVLGLSWTKHGDPDDIIEYLVTAVPE
jgi:hypothetical protein